MIYLRMMEYDSATERKVLTSATTRINLADTINERPDPGGRVVHTSARRKFPEQADAQRQKTA